jgi:hypothetical protein
MVPDVLLGKTMPVMRANDRIGQVEILDHGLELASVAFGNPATKDHRQFRRLADRPIRIEEALAQSVQRRAAAEDQVVAVFHINGRGRLCIPSAHSSVTKFSSATPRDRLRSECEGCPWRSWSETDQRRRHHG